MPSSTNGGSTWTQLPGTSLLTAFAIAISPNYAKDQTLFIGTMQQGLLKSTDGGTTFTAITAAPGPSTSGTISRLIAENSQNRGGLHSVSNALSTSSLFFCWIDFST